MICNHHALVTKHAIPTAFQARPLKTKELADPEISAVIAEKMAQVHSLDVPISKEPSWIWDTMKRWLSSAKAQQHPPPNEDDGNKPNNGGKRPAGKLCSIDLRWQLDAEMDWMRNYLDQLQSPVVFCHNEYG